MEEEIQMQRKAGNEIDWGTIQVQGRMKTEVHRGRDLQRLSEA